MFGRTQAHEYCLSVRGSRIDLPFGPDVAVFKVLDKMFALLSLEGEPARLSLKCDPFLGEDLARRFPAVRPGYHLNKRHWITIDLDGSLEEQLIRELILASLDLVVRGLSRAERQKWEDTP